MEYVQQRMEELAVVFKDIEKLGIVETEVLSEVINEFRRHELRIQKPSRSLEEILSYADFQRKFLAAIQAKRIEAQQFENQDKVEDKLKFRINSLFGLHERNFYNYIEFWLARIEFVKGMGWVNITSKTYLEAAKRIGMEYPEFWKDAADYEYNFLEQDKSDTVVSARNILLSGIRQNPRTLRLYIWAYQLEIRHAKHLEHLDGPENVKGAQNCLQAAKVIYKRAKHKCSEDLMVCEKNFEFYVLASEEEFDFLCSYILRDLEMRFPKCQVQSLLADLSFRKKDERGAIFQLYDTVKESPTKLAYEWVSNVLQNQIKDQDDPVQQEKYMIELHKIMKQGHELGLLSTKSYKIWGVCFTYITSSVPLEFAEDMKGEYVTSVCECVNNNSKPDHELVILGISQYMLYGCQGAAFENFVRFILKWNVTQLKPYSNYMKMFFMCMLSPEKSKNQVNLELLKEFTAKMVTICPSVGEAYLQFQFLRSGCSIKVYRELFDELQMIKSSSMCMSRANVEFVYGVDNTLSCDVRYDDVLRFMEEACQVHGISDLSLWVQYITYASYKSKDAANLVYQHIVNLLPEDKTRDFHIILQESPVVESILHPTA